ncbi:MAG: hypothetical protein PUG43_03780 [Clostridiales bacterium]|nr:hypothetical protein [Clostridiales bacterium]MDY4061053.1 hypothetical protein [Anaerovoracaceae bacterium]
MKGICNEKRRIFVSDKCPDSVPVMEIITRENLDIEMVNITESMINLREFLKYRDSDEFFAQTREEGLVGIPVLMYGDGKMFAWIDEESKILE